MKRTGIYFFYLKRESGMKVIEAITGEEGVEMAIREGPDLVLMDIQPARYRRI